MLQSIYIYIYTHTHTHTHTHIYIYIYIYIVLLLYLLIYFFIFKIEWSSFKLGSQHRSRMSLPFQVEIALKKLGGLTLSSDQFIENQFTSWNLRFLLRKKCRPAALKKVSSENMQILREECKRHAWRMNKFFIEVRSWRFTANSSSAYETKHLDGLHRKKIQYIYINIYVCACVCVCVVWKVPRSGEGYLCRDMEWRHWHINRQCLLIP